MNSFLVLGLACADSKFREQLFADAKGAIDAVTVPLAWAESEALEMLFAPGSAHCDELKQALDVVGSIIKKSPCPRQPCPWPSAFTQNLNTWPPVPPPPNPAA
jgi:hypothetical protein